MMIEGSLGHGGREFRGWVYTLTWELMEGFLEDVAGCGS